MTALFQPTPFQPPMQGADILWVDAKNCTNLFVRLRAISAGLAYSTNIILTKFRSWSFRPSWEPSPRNSISHILFVRPNRKMFDVNAGWIVAGMHDNQPARYITFKTLPHSPVGDGAALSGANHAIALSVFSADPFQAAVIAFNRFFKKLTKLGTESGIGNPKELAAAVFTSLFGRGLVKIWHNQTYSGQGIPRQGDVT